LRKQRLVVGRGRGGSKLQFLQQRRIALGKADDHLDEALDAFGAEMLADFGKSTGGFLQRPRTEAIGGERGCHQMLAKSPLGKGRAGALPGEFLPGPDQFAAVDLRADDSRQNASPVKRNDLDVLVVMIIDTAREDFLAGNFTQGGDVEPVQAGGCLDRVRGALRLARHRRGL
jgi:hypothetical protein